MLGCVETEGKIGDITIFLQLYNQCKSKSVASTASSRGGGKGTLRFMDDFLPPHPTTSRGRRGRGTRKWRPAQDPRSCRVNTTRNGLWDAGMWVLTQVSITQLRQWYPWTWVPGWGNTLGNQTLVRRSQGDQHPSPFEFLYLQRKGQGKNSICF